MTKEDILRTSKFWVLAPSLETSDPNLGYYYDFTQSIEEYTRAFSDLGVAWQWQPVTMDNYIEVISSIRSGSNGLHPVVINLCDGDEINGTPGISIIRELERQGLTYTGSDGLFYELTTSKITMKTSFDKHGVCTAPWEIITDNLDTDGLFDRIGSPVILKPAVSGGSMGVTLKNVVHTGEELQQRLHELMDGYHGWDLASGGILAERFIVGPEYTTFLIGSSDIPDGTIVYEPVERVFHESLPATERFLSFDRLWEIYEDETPMPNHDNFYAYHPVKGDLNATIKQLSVDAYQAVRGQGYGRLDIRMDEATGKLYVLEVNAQCGLSEDEDYTSIGAILKVTDKSFAEMITEIVQEAFHRKNTLLQYGVSL